MLHHLWFDTGEMHEEVTRRRSWTNPTTRQPVPRRGGGARRAVGRALIGLGERIAAERRDGIAASD
jgi:hypothetical protein